MRWPWLREHHTHSWQEKTTLDGWWAKRCACGAAALTIPEAWWHEPEPVIAPPRPALDPIPSAPLSSRKEPSIVSQVIREQSGGDPRLAGYLRSYATRLERDGESPEDIALHLSEWESTEGYTLPAEVSI